MENGIGHTARRKIGLPIDLSTGDWVSAELARGLLRVVETGAGAARRARRSRKQRRVERALPR